MKSTFRNQFHRYEATIRHRGEVPAYSTISRHIRASRPSNCTKMFAVTYNFSAAVNQLTESQVLGNGCVDHETGRMSDFGEKIMAAKVGETITKHHAFGQFSIYLRTA
jgi:hypothetical protein